MYNSYNKNPCLNNNMPWYMNPYYYNTQMQNNKYMNRYPEQYMTGQYNTNPIYMQYPTSNGFVEIKDYGPNPFVIDINEAAEQNNNFRTSLWTGDHLQITLMSINVGEDIGLEMHPDVDQFIRIEEGRGIVRMGDSSDTLNFQESVNDDFAFVIPAGKWHNLINTGNVPLKLYSIYAPPQHPHGTVHQTKEIADAAENHNIQE